MTRHYARLVGLTVLVLAVVRTPSDALQETPTLQQITEVHIRADAGDAAAQVTLGGWYFAGSGMPQDTDEGVRWWRQAAEQGHLPSQTGLGGRYLNGRGVERDEAEAFRWYRMAAEQGDEEVLAFMHLSAEQGSMTAQVSLAEMYAEGRGVVRDEMEAVRWRQSVPQAPPLEELIDPEIADLRARAEQDDLAAQVSLGDIYDTGEGIAQDAGEAVRWYRRAAEQGDVAVQVTLGGMYFAGRGVPQDAVEAVRWYRLAAKQGDAEAQQVLGVMYTAGRGVARDPGEAVRWVRRAAEQGDAEAQLTLGVMYAAGRGVAQDEAEAVRWFRRAMAQFSLGDAFADDRGVGQDDVNTHMWLDLAAARSTGELQESVIRSRDTVAQWMTLNQIAEAQRRAREWDTVRPR